MLKRTAFWGLYMLMVLLILELFIRITGSMKTYTEKTTGYYSSVYGQHPPTWYHTYVANSTIIYDQPEFKFSYPANSLGLREKEFSTDRPDSVKRLIFLGDSFTEGDGVDYPYSMPRDIEHKLDSAKLNFQVMDAGICGSDPLYEFVLLRDKLLKYHPTHVILCTNNSDVLDCVYRGGMERFLPDGTTLYKPGKWWLPIYAHCHLFRLFIRIALGNTNETFLSENDLLAAKEKAKKEIYQSLLSLEQLCEQHQIKLAVVAHPFPNTYNFGKISDDIDDFVKANPNPPFRLINTFNDFGKVLNKDNYLTYSWQINGHFNNKGYQLFADIIYQDINTQYPNFWQ